MATTKETGRLIEFLIIGAIVSMIGGVLMAMFTMIATVTYLHMGFFTPMYAMAAPLIGRQTLMTSMTHGLFYFALGPAVLGLVLHMMGSAFWGIIFGLIARGLHLSGAAAVISGLIYGLVVMLIMAYIVVPIVGAPNLLQMVGWSFLISHLLYGLPLGLWPVLRPQDWPSLLGQQMRRTA